MSARLAVQSSALPLDSGNEVKRDAERRRCVAVRVTQQGAPQNAERTTKLQGEAGGDSAVSGVGVALRGRLAVLQEHLRYPAVVEAGEARDVVQPMQFEREGLAASAVAEALAAHGAIPRKVMLRLRRASARRASAHRWPSETGARQAGR